MVTAQFLNIGGTGNTNLQDIIPTGDDTSDNVFIQTLDSAGYTVDNYSWNDWATDKACWVDDNYEEVTGVTFTPGQGLWVQGAAATQGLQTAGKVGVADISVTLRAGCTATGNPFPTAVDLQDIIPEGDDTSDNVFIQTLDSAGYTVDNYSWNDWATDKACWVDDNYEEVTGVTIEPGAGLWVQGSSSSQYLRFPAPEL